MSPAVGWPGDADHAQQSLILASLIGENRFSGLSSLASISSICFSFIRKGKKVTH